MHTANDRCYKHKSDSDWILMLKVDQSDDGVLQIFTENMAQMSQTFKI